MVVVLLASLLAPTVNRAPSKSLENQDKAKTKQESEKKQGKRNKNKIQTGLLNGKPVLRRGLPREWEHPYSISSSNHRIYKMIRLCPGFRAPGLIFPFPSFQEVSNASNFRYQLLGGNHLNSGWWLPESPPILDGHHMVPNQKFTPKYVRP